MPKPGDSFDRYTIETQIGAGGMGAVYRAHDERLGRRVALKVLSDFPPETGGPTQANIEANTRLVREARAAAALNHPNAVSIYDVGEVDGVPFIVMELVPGKTLREVLVDKPSIPTRIGWLTHVAQALAAAHNRGLVHRDIKPENVMVRDDGVVKVLDFGIARRAGGHVDPQAGTQLPALTTLTKDGLILGTPAYMAPEQLRNLPLDGRTDQFGWGVLAYELFTGRLPWSSHAGNGQSPVDSVALISAILTDEADPKALDEAHVPAKVRDILIRSLSKRSADRFANMDELIAALSEPIKTNDVQPTLSTTDEQRYSTQAVRQVLAQAVDRQAAKQGDTRLAFAELLEIAREVGVDEQSLREASRIARATPPETSATALTTTDDEYPAWLRRRRRSFARHVGVWTIVNAGFVVLGMLVSPHLWPFLLPALFWGIGLAIHGLVALTSNEDDFVEQKKQLEIWRDRRQKRNAIAARVTNRVIDVLAPPKAPQRLRIDDAIATSQAKAEPAETEALHVTEAQQRAKRGRH